MEPKMVAFAIALSFSTLCAMAAFRFVYLPAITSWFRQCVFFQRRKLFLLAADGEVEFNSAVYVRLRNEMNGTLQFAERVSVWRIVFTNLAMSKTDQELLRIRYGQQQEEVPSSPVVDEIRDAYTKAVAHYLVLASPTLMAAGLILLLLSPIMFVTNQLGAVRARWRAYVARGAERLTNLPPACNA